MCGQVARDHAPALLPGDAVGFHDRGRQRYGIVVRSARLTVVVAVADGGLFRVPHGLLAPEKPQAEAGRLHDVAARAQALLERHGLDDWSFAFDRAKRRGGACHFVRRQITVAAGFAATADEAEIEDTLLHEIAHALVGRRHHHDPVWQAKAREIGCSARRCHSVSFSEPTLIARCANGCFAVGRHRSRRNMRCRRCGGAVTYTRAGRG
ncbi:MAG: SprT-like domain-containing protein [Geminicoccaceae bacterium]